MRKENKNIFDIISYFDISKQKEKQKNDDKTISQKTHEITTGLWILINNKINVGINKVYI